MFRSFVFQELRFEENRASAWYEYLFYKDKIKEHPCDINNVKACSFWSDLVLNRKRTLTEHSLAMISLSLSLMTTSSWLTTAWPP